MITWNKNMWTSDSTRPLISQIKRRVRWRRATSAMHYCIAIATNDSNLLDIFNMGELLFKYYQSSDEEIHIVGLAESRDAACELSKDILMDIYTKTGGFDVKKYFGKRE